MAKLLICKNHKPLTRPSDDLFHKGRGILTHDPRLTILMNGADRVSLDTSPLVEEVVRRTGEGSFLPYAQLPYPFQRDRVMTMDS